MKSAGRCEEKGCNWCQDWCHYCFCQALEPSQTARRRSSWSTMDEVSIFFQMPQCDEFRKALEVPCPMWRLRPGSGRQAGHDWSWCHHEMILAEEGWCHVVPLNLPFLSRSFQILQKSLLGSMHRNIPKHTETVHLFKDISGIPKPS
jgi:hypothetical protein